MAGVTERQPTEHSAWYPSALKTPAGSMAVTNHPHREILLASLQAETNRGAEPHIGGSCRCSGIYAFT